MKEGSEGDGGGGGSSDDVPTSRDADSTVPTTNGTTGTTNGPRLTHDGIPLGGTTLANALLGIALDRGASNGDSLLVHSTKGGRGGDAPANNNNRDKVFVCNICNRCFGYKHVLQNHERTHTGEKPFECRECHKRFTRDHHLKTHMRLHTGEKPYHCSHCERQFVQVANLRRHLRVHTGERPYACTLCNSCFSDSNQLKAHRLIHEGIKPFECDRCKGRFRRRHHLVHHKCPKDEANIGKPRRGRRPKAYEEMTLLSPVIKQERMSTPILDMKPPPTPPAVAVSLTSVIKREGPSPPLMPQPAHMPPQQARRNHHLNHHPLHHHLPLLGLGSNGGFHHHDSTIQTGPLDMTKSSASAPVSVIVPRIPAYHPHHQTNHHTTNSMDGVLDLSNSRSDSDAEPIEEEVDEEDDLIDEGVDSEESDEDDMLAWKDDKLTNNHHQRHLEDLRRGNGERDTSNVALHL